MINSNTELMQYVLDDVQKYDGFRHFEKASIPERLFMKKRPPEQLHPNPYDEFSMPEIGPHFGIINDYCMRYVSPKRVNDEGLQEPLIIEKLAGGGYMLLNGHHRWAAALKVGVKKVPVKVVNLTHEEDHIKMMEQSKNVKRVTFDLDEVLCTTEAHPKEEETPRLLFRGFEKIYKERLRWGAPFLINELQRHGYDVWVFTNTYNSVEYIQSFFKAYHVKIDGIVNGAGRKKSKKSEEQYKELVAKKYKLIYYVDNDGVLRVIPGKKDFESYDLEDADHNWANKVMKIINDTSGDEI